MQASVNSSITPQPKSRSEWLEVSPMSGYTTQEVSALIGLKPHQVRHYVRRDLLQPERGANGEFLFSFQDMVLLKTAKGLIDSAVTPRRALKVLVRLKEQIPDRTALSAMRIVKDGSAVVVCSENRYWNAETGQNHLPLEEPAPVVSVSTILGGGYVVTARAGEMTSDEWYNLGLDLEETDSDQAPQAYRKAIELDPTNADAHVNAGRLLQLQGNLRLAKRHYELALRTAPGHQLANYNLGTIFDELDELEKAAMFYRLAPAVPDAHYNLARIAELGGDEISARRHMRRYRDMIEENAKR
jgi:tetratricopeptide (TPR) repeat protein